MKNTVLFNGIALILMVSLFSCSPKNKISDPNKMEEQKEAIGGTVVKPSPPVILYKTKGDYYDKVPVILSEDKSKISSYPGPKDLIRNKELALPIKLNDGYLLDVRGINKNVAFLDITYGAYTKSMQVFTAQKLYDMIIDKDPLLEMYDCGSKKEFNDEVLELNSIIDEGKLDSFIRLK